MKPPLSRIAIIGVVLVAAVLLGGCSTLRMGYTQGPDLAYWWLQRYVDFDDTQAPRVRAELADWFRWHRQHELPDYAELLARAQREIVEPVTPEQVCGWSDTLEQRIDRAFAQALPALADEVRALTPAQIERMERKYTKNRDEYRRDFAQDDPQERHAAQAKRVTKRAETLYGRLDEAQRARIAELVADSPLDPQAWLVERAARQQETVRTLRRLADGHADAAQARTEVQRLYDESVHESPRADYRDYQRRMTAWNCRLAAEVHNMTTPPQRAVAVRRLKGWEEDARTLAAAR